MAEGRRSWYYAGCERHQGEYGQVANRAREFSDLRIVLDHCVYGSNFPTKLYNPKLSYVEALRLFSEAIDLSEAERK
ncbi:MAG TPA: hypothetical protein DIU35_03810 [Candidatus Latescibacteria bacterium]|nr:hypothetical protein [Candidatus Latescibacterota bacterium]